MKKFALLFILTVVSISSYAQDKLVNIGFGGGLSVMSTNGNDNKMSGVGGHFFVDLYINVTPNLSLGAEYEGAIGALEPNNDYPANFGNTDVRNISGKILYHFGQNRVRPYIELGIGQYTMVAGQYYPDLDTNIETERPEPTSTIGYAPEVGVDLGWIGFGVVYHIAPNLEITDSQNDVFDINYNSLEVRAVINLSFIER